MTKFHVLRTFVLYEKSFIAYSYNYAILSILNNAVAQIFNIGCIIIDAEHDFFW